MRQVRSLRHQVPSKLAALLPEVMRNSLVFTVSSDIPESFKVVYIYIHSSLNDMIYIYITRYTCRILESIVQVGEYCLQSYWWSYMSRLSKCLAVATWKDSYETLPKQLSFQSLWSCGRCLGWMKSSCAGLHLWMLPRPGPGLSGSDIGLFWPVLTDLRCRFPSNVFQSFACLGLRIL